MDVAPPLIDPWSADQLEGGRLDPLRAFCLPAPHADIVARAAAALANSRGGDLLLGAMMAPDGTLTRARGLPVAEAEAVLAAGLAKVDPPIGHLVRTRLVETPVGGVLVVRVRMSPSTPHLVTDTGVIPRLTEEGLRPVTRRRELDELYARGRGERERAGRLIDAMAEKLALAHYAFYSLAIIACTHEPSAEPFSAAVAGALAPADDPFVHAHGLHEAQPRVGPGEIELRTPGETGAYIRVTRNGSVAAGEVQRRPYHEELDTVARLRARLEALAATACRLLASAEDAVMVPQLFVEGVRGLRLVLDPERRLTTRSAPQDTGRYPLALGSPRDPDYPRRLAEEALSRLEALFPPPTE
jgi:hypothetical protein